MNDKQSHLDNLYELKQSLREIQTHDNPEQTDITSHKQEAEELTEELIKLITKL